MPPRLPESEPVPPRPSTPVPPGERGPEQTIPDALTSVRWRLSERGPTWSRLVVFAHLKGGSTKSTSAGTYALRLAEHTGQNVLLVDADTRSKTVTMWKDTLVGAGLLPANVRVETWPVNDLSGRISAAIAEGWADHVVVDTGGHDELIVQQAITAGAAPRAAKGNGLRVTGVDVVMPLAPTDPEAFAVGTTFGLVSGLGWLTKIRFRALLTRVSPRGYDDADYIRATGALDHAGIPWFETYIPYLVKHSRVVGTVPRPVGPAPRPDDAGNYDALLAETLADDPLEVLP